MNTPAHGTPTRVALVRAGCWPDQTLDRELPRSPYLSEHGARLLALASSWPELEGERRGRVGVYQALGQEKMALSVPLFETIHGKGFDALRPAALIFCHSPYGAATSLAVNIDCQGPFFTLEADRLSGGVATLQALTDLRRGRCELALVCSSVGGQAWLTLLRRTDEAGGLDWRARFVNGTEEPPDEAMQQVAASLGADLALSSVAYGRDAHGMQAVQRAMQRAGEGVPTAVWSVTPDLRGALLAFAAAGHREA